MKMRPRDELRKIARTLTNSPTQADLVDAQRAIVDLLDDRSRLAAKLLRAMEDAEKLKEKDITSRKKSTRWLRFFGRK